MEKTLAEIRRLMLATTKIDGAYYLFSRRLGIKENVLVLLYALVTESRTLRNKSARIGSFRKLQLTPTSRSWSAQDT